jgi:predicted nucleic acid-binding protein
MSIRFSSRRSPWSNSKPPIERIPARQWQRADALHEWLDGLVTKFGDRIYPVDLKVAVRAGRLLPHCHDGHVRHRFHDAVLAATALVYGHTILTKRVTIFGDWMQIKVTSL